MKLIKSFLFFLVFLLLFTACDKNKPEERIFGRWKITGYQLDGVDANDTIQKYYQGYEYEIKEIGKDGQGACNCNSVVVLHNYVEGPSIDKTNIDENGLSTSALQYYRTPPPLCDSTSVSLGCLSIYYSYSIIDDQTMIWKATEILPDYPMPHSHEFTFSKVN